MKRRTWFSISLLVFLLAVSAMFTPTAIAQTARATQTGWLTLLWGDDVPGTSTPRAPRLLLFDDNGKPSDITLTAELTRDLGGILGLNRQRVVVEGEWTRAVTGSQTGRVIARAIRRVETRSAPRTQTSGAQPWVTIMCKFADIAAEPKSLTYFQAMLDNTKPGLNHYWREQAYDAMNLDGSAAAGWFTLPHTRAEYIRSDGAADLHALADDCTAAAEASIAFPNFAGIHLAFNADLDCCAWGGNFTLTKNGVTRAWNLTWLPPWAYNDLTVLAHEMGHGLGLPHSSSVYARGYDNPWDVMSDPWSNCSNLRDSVYGCLGQHTIAYHKDRLGWIPSPQKFIGATGAITLEQLAMPQSNNYKLAQIPIGDSATRFYTVEVRRRVGYDAKLPNQVVIIHEVDTTRANPAYVMDNDGNGNTGDAGAQWTVGEVFTDAANNISIAITAATATGYRITIGAPPSQRIHLPLLLR
ncbi:MAG: hypothetical protein HZC40_13455 [Chloroflexi bacterium]|nr:hypothetical protein [Chloroflexota bacterium]